MNEFEDSDFGGEVEQRIYQNMVEEEQELLQKRQELDKIKKQNEVNNFQEAATVPLDAGRAIIEDIAKTGGAEPSWMGNEERAPELQTTWGKTLSGIAQVIVPLLAFSYGKGRGLRALRNRGMLKNIPVGSAKDRLANLAADVGAEVGWYNITRQAEQDNLTGQLAQLGIPVPDWLATGKGDTAEMKRTKQQLEAVGLGVFGSLLGGLFRLGKAPIGRFTSKLRGKDAAGEAYVEQLAKKGGTSDVNNPALDEVLRDENLRAQSDGEMALKRLADNGGQVPDPWDADPDNYIQSKLFDESERVPKAVPAEGVVEAIVDNYQIAKNPSGNGRMQRFMTDAALDAISQGDLEKRTIIKGLQTQINEFASKNLDVDVGGRWKNNKEIVAEMDKIVSAMLDVPLEDLKKIVPYDDVTVAPGKKIKVVDPFWEQAFIKLSKRYINEFSMSGQRASALAQTSIANDISDSANAISVVKGELDTTRAQDRILDMLEFLQYEQTLAGSYRGWALQARKNGLGLTNATVKDWMEEAAKKSAQVKKLVNEIKELRVSNPRMADAVESVYELTNGSITDINMMYQAIEDSVKGRRVVKNWGYASPGVLVEAISSVFYAAKLSSLYTPVKAIMNNAANFIMKPINQALGGKGVRRAWAQYANGSAEYMRISAKLMSDRYKQVANLPIEQLARADYSDRIVQQQAWLDAAQAYADESGDLLMQMKVNFANTMNAFGNHKNVRYSTNIMEAGDAALNVALVLTDKRGQMIDDILAKKGKITPDEIAGIDQWIKDNGEMYARGALDGDMKPIDTALRYQAGEIAMNLDGNTRGLTALLNKSPILKTFILFPKTALNSLSFVAKNSPLSIVGGDLYKTLTLKEPAAIEAFLKTKGLPYSEDAWRAFKQETRGRVILGTTFMGYAWNMWAQGNMTGNGPYDKSTNSVNRNMAQEPVRSWRLAPGMPWISYDGVEPISTLLAFTVDLADNHEVLGKGRLEDIAQRVAFIFADNLTNKTFVQGLRPLLDIAAGKPTVALSKHAANTMSVSAINQLGRIIDPAYREVEDDFMSQLRNKWSVLDALGIGDPLPYEYNIVTGQKVEPGIELGLGALFPVRISKTQTRAQEILSETEFNVNAALDSIEGIELDAQQRSEIKRIIGERGVFAKAIVKAYDNPRNQKELADLRKARAGGINSDVVPYDRTNNFLGTLLKVLTKEVKYAKDVMLRNDDTLRQEQTQKYQIKRATQLSDYDEINRLLGIN